MKKILRARTAVIAAIMAVGLGGGLTVAAPSAHATDCTISLGGTCGAYADSTDFPPSNGFNTYVDDQSVGPNTGTTESLVAHDATSWTATSDAVPLGSTNVQTFPSTQQGFNDWNGSGWGGTGGTSNTPLNSLSALTVNFSITPPADTADNIFEYGSDLWSDYSGILGGGTGDVMMWPYTSSLRCTENGLSDVSILGHVTIASQVWTAYRYGPFGGEIVFILNGSGTSGYDPVTSGTCGQETSGTLDQKAAMDWLVANGDVAGPQHVTLLVAGYEIESADNADFTQDSLSMTATVGSGGPAGYAPYVTTNDASGVSVSGATVDGSVLPENQSTSYQFDYGTTTSYGSNSTSSSAGSGYQPVDENAVLSGLAPSTTYHYRIEATNATGTTDGADQVFTTPCDCTTYSLWDSSVTPGTTSQSDSSSYELGTRWVPSEDGQVDAIRFYKGSGNTGTHTGTLWTATGTRLGTVTFTGETSSGWQTAEFSTPIAVTAGTAYVVSYHDPNGHYADDSGYFTSSDHVSGPLTAPHETTGVPNGVFVQTDSIAFPDTSFNQSNYYVDVVFEPKSLLGDTATESNADSDSAGVAEAFPYVAGSGGTSAAVHFYVGSSNAATGGVVGIYDDDGDGNPGTLLGYASFTPAAGWDIVTLSGVSITQGDTYWIAVLGTGGTLAFVNNGDTGTYSETTGTGLTSLPSTFGSGFRWNTGVASAFVSG